MTYFYLIATLLFFFANTYYIFKNKKNKFILAIFSIQIVLTAGLFILYDSSEIIKTTSAIGSCCLIIILSKINN